MGQRILFLILTSLILAAGQAAAQESPEEGREARLTKIDGTVYLHLSGQGDDEFVKAQEDATLDEGDLIRTGEDGQAELTLDGESIISLGPNSDFVVTSLAREKTEFHLALGSLVAKIWRLLGEESFEFHTPTAVAAVRGTELAISQEEDERTAHVGVMDEGLVSVRPAADGEEVGLEAGQEIECAKGRLGRPRALARLAKARGGMGRLRSRLGQMKKGWKPRNRGARGMWRKRLREAGVLRPEQLRGVRRELLKRRYGQVRARGEQLRQERVRQREERGKKRQDLQRKRQEMRQEQRQQQEGRQEQGLEQRPRGKGLARELIDRREKRQQKRQHRRGRQER